MDFLGLYHDRIGAGKYPRTAFSRPVFGTADSNAFTNPIWFGEVPGKTGTYLVVEQGVSPYTDSARVWVLIPDSNGAYQKREFLGLKVQQNMTERGIIGFAFHPKYAQNGKYYVNYVPPVADSDSIVIEERRAGASLLQDSGLAPRRILGVVQPTDHHHGGNMAFGRDGYLYVGMGDGGNEGNGLQTLLGAMLRLDVDHPAGGLGYSIPSTNPFKNNADTTVKKEIWAYGLRNPWRWSFDALTGGLWVADVGENTAEEVDRVAKGGNMGWPTMEGKGCFSYSDVKPACDTTGLTLPVMDFTRDQAQAIIGGYVYRGSRTSALYGAYIFGDWALKRVYAMKQIRNVWQLAQIASTTAEISSFGTDSKNNIYMLGHNDGVVYLLDLSAVVPEWVPVSIQPSLKNESAEKPGPHLVPVLDGGPLGADALRNEAAATLFSLQGAKAARVGQGTVPRLSAGVYIAR